MRNALDTIKNARDTLSELFTERKLEEQNLAVNEKKQIEIQSNIDELKVIQEILQAASKLMYANLSVKLGNVISEGLALVFPESDYSFSVEFVERRNQIEADMFIVDSAGNKYDPINDIGGGITDFVSLLLRITYIALSKHRNVIAADEPSKFISHDKIHEATVFLSKVCEDLKFHLLVITHIPAMVEVAKTRYTVVKKGSESRLRKMNKLSFKTEEAC